MLAIFVKKNLLEIIVNDNHNLEDLLIFCLIFIFLLDFHIEILIEVQLAEKFTFFFVESDEMLCAVLLASQVLWCLMFFYSDI